MTGNNLRQWADPDLVSEWAHYDRLYHDIGNAPDDVPGWYANYLIEKRNAFDAEIKRRKRAGITPTNGLESSVDFGFRDSVQAVTDIVDLIGETVNLRQNGRRWRALCPLHDDRDPSLVVYPETQSWYCFGACKVGGSCFDWIMQRDGLNFVEALKVLARRAGLDPGERIRQTPKPDQPPPHTQPLPAVSVPELPRMARLGDAALAQAEQVGLWLGMYTDYASERSPMTPRAFHEAGGLWLGSVAIARRLYCPLPHDNIWPNLYLLWVADTTLFAKSTALKIVEGVAYRALNHLLLPQEFTPEALLSEMAGKDPPGMDDLPDETRELWQARRNFAAQRGLVADEFSGLLASARKDYNAGLTETILRLHDCPPQWAKRTQSHGLVRVRNAYLSILSATTPSALGPFVAKGAWMSGFWPRFALLSPEEDKPAFRRAEKQPRRPEAMVEHLSWLACKALSSPTYPNPPEAQPVRFTDDALEAWKRYDKAVRYDLLTGDLDESLWGLYGRLPTQGVKVALILAALDWDGERQPVIEVGHWARAQQIVESWRASVHRLLVPARVQAEQRQEEKLIGIVSRAGRNGYTAREVGQLANQPRGDVEPALERLVKDGILDVYVPKGARVKRYKASKP